MKLNARDAVAWIAKPPADRPGTLIYGADPMRVALKRADLILAMIGPQGDDEMRLTRIAAGDLRRDKALLADALKAQGFFPGPRVAFLEDANAHVADTVAKTLGDWREGDAHIVVTAGTLRPTSPLRKAFEKHPRAAAIAVYDDPPNRAEIETALAKVGLDNVPADAMAELIALASQIDPGDFRQTLEKMALYKMGSDQPLGSDDIAICAPASIEADLDDVLGVVADAQTHKIGPLMRRLESQGVQPVALTIGATRHFRTLHAAASDPSGPGQGVGRLRPPVFGPRRDALLRQAQGWGLHRLEQAIALLIETDLTLRSAARAPQMALVERTFIRLSMMGKR